MCRCITFTQEFLSQHSGPPCIGNFFFFSHLLIASAPRARVFAHLLQLLRSSNYVPTLVFRFHKEIPILILNQSDLIEYLQCVSCYNIIRYLELSQGHKLGEGYSTNHYSACVLTGVFICRAASTYGI